MSVSASVGAAVTGVSAKACWGAAGRARAASAAIRMKRMALIASAAGCESSAGALYPRPMSRPFLKMNGLGNDFVVVEARPQPFAPSEAEARAIADRADGIGCDQLIAIEPSDSADA